MRKQCVITIMAAVCANENANAIAIAVGQDAVDIQRECSPKCTFTKLHDMSLETIAQIIFIRAFLLLSLDIIYCMNVCKVTHGVSHIKTDQRIKNARTINGGVHKCQM